MTSQSSNIWKKFLYSDQSTLYNNELIQYNVDNNECLDINKNVFTIENFIYYHLEIFSLIFIFLMYYLKR